jgi:hypothetical protein
VIRGYLSVGQSVIRGSLSVGQSIIRRSLLVRQAVICGVRVTTALLVLMLRMEERPPVWKVAANMLNKQSQTADKEWSYSLVVGRSANNSSQ